MRQIKKRRFAEVLLFIIVLCFFCKFCFVKINSVKTEPAEYTSVEDVIKIEGFSVWDETVLDLNKSGGVVYKINDGERAAKGEVIADIYENPKDADVENEIKYIDEEIKSLTTLDKTEIYDLRNPDVLDLEISKTIVAMQMSLAESNYSEAFGYKDKFMRLVSEDKLAKGKNENFEETINNLNEKRKSLESSISGDKQSFLSPMAGCFVSFLDGYENLVNYEDIKKSRIENFGFENTEPENREGHLGKIISSGDWYIICKISDENKQKLKKGMECEIRIPSVDDKGMVSTVYDLISLDPDVNVAVICCRCMNKEILKFRKGEIYLKLNEYYGYKLKKSSLCYRSLENNSENSDDLIGVNVKYGNSILFKKIKIIYSGEEFVVASEEDVSEEDDIQYLKRGDEVIV